MKTVKVSDETHRRLKTIAAQRGESIQTVAERELIALRKPLPFLTERKARKK